MLNKTNIEWTDFTWNPVTGCRHGCYYCYGPRYAKEQSRNSYPNGFEPTFHAERIRDPMYKLKPSKIFVCSMGDLWSPGVDDDWRRQVLETVNQCPQHTFQFLSKNPNIANTIFPNDNIWAGMSVEGDHNRRLNAFNNIDVSVRFLSIEPLLRPSAIRLEDLDIHWIIIGAATGPRAIKPKRQWIDELVYRADELSIPVFIKNNILRYHPDYPIRHEYPRIDNGKDVSL